LYISIDAIKFIILIHTLIRLYRRYRYGRYGWFGNYSDWQEAKEKCTGYHGTDILQKVRSATLQVQRGTAVYERDALLFDKIEYSWPLLANLLWIAAANNQQLSVVDFGGSLGSSYFQNRRYTDGIKNLQWKVVEQPQFVDTGRADIAHGQLFFYYSIREALETSPSQVLLLSCVLPYLDDPFTFLTEVMTYHFPYIIIDNTYFNPVKGNRLTIQKVPPLYYNASYPAWFLDYETIKTTLAVAYDVVEEYTNEQFLYLYGEKINYRGLLLKKRTHNESPVS
jgi:putative methyltransferase (TIGR04325 family)